MASIPQAIGGVGVGCVGISAALFTQSGQASASVLIAGVAGTALLYAGFSKKSIARGKKGVDLEKQTKFIKGSGEWVTEKSEDGVDIKVLHGPKGIVSLPMKGTPQKDKDGLIYSKGANIHTLYDLLIKPTDNDGRNALGRCIRQHTFKDAIGKDGKPNPKPMIVDTPGEWQFLTYGDMKRQSRAFGTSLKKDFGVERKEKIAIWAGNSVEWLIADLACSIYTWTSVSVYDTLGPDAASFIIGDSGAKVLVCEDKTFKKVPALLNDPIYTANAGADLEIVVYLGKGDPATQKILEEMGKKVVGFHDAVKRHEGALAPDDPPAKDELVTIMYTSGTTGNPKGVMLTHANIASTACMLDMSHSLDIFSTDEYLSYLPLAHIFERIVCFGLLSKGGVIWMASNGAKGLLADLPVVRPTLFAGVPKVYENVRDAVKRKMTGFKKTLFDAAMAAKSADLETGCGYSPLWDMLIFNKTKAALGGRVRFCVTGGAPISKDTLTFVVCAIGPICQGYGATETSAASTVTMAFDLNVGHVGPPLGQVAVRLVDVPEMNYFNGKEEEYKDDPKSAEIFKAGRNKNGGEVWIGGYGVSPGYYDPSANGLKKGIPSNGMAKKTEEEFFMEDGHSWFKTGDIGSWTARGPLKIVDRRKNLFKTSLGEYVAVEEVEKVYQDYCGFADFVYLPKETKVAYIGLIVVVSESAGTAMKWAKENNVPGDAEAVISSKEFKKEIFDQLDAGAKEKKLQGFCRVRIENLHVQYLAPGYQEQWVEGVECANGHKEQLLTATFKARRTQLDAYFAPVFPKVYPDRPSDHILP